MGQLHGKSAVVTGVGSGLGHAVARALAAEGAYVLGCDIDDGAGKATMSNVGEYRHANVAVEADVEALMEGAVRAFGSLDVLVNNAAIQIEEELAETTEEQLDSILAVNLKGVFFGCKHAVRAMRHSGGGTIVNVASILALVGDGRLAAYCAAKAGVLGVTRATAVRYGPDGIRCNAICPGDIETPLVEAYLAGTNVSRATMEQAYPLGRISQPDEIARAIVFLASDDSSFMSGQPLILDGGLLAKCY